MPALASGRGRIGRDRALNATSATVIQIRRQICCASSRIRVASAEAAIADDRAFARTASSRGNIQESLAIVSTGTAVLNVDLRFFADAVANLARLRADLQISTLLATVFHKHVRIRRDFNAGKYVVLATVDAPQLHLKRRTCGNRHRHRARVVYRLAGCYRDILTSGSIRDAQKEWLAAGVRCGLERRRNTSNGYGRIGN